MKDRAASYIIKKLLARKEISVGTPVAGRRHADLEQINGVFINILLLRANLALKMLPHAVGFSRKEPPWSPKAIL